MAQDEQGNWTLVNNTTGRPVVVETPVLSVEFGCYAEALVKAAGQVAEIYANGNFNYGPKYVSSMNDILALMQEEAQVVQVHSITYRDAGDGTVLRVDTPEKDTIVTYQYADLNAIADNQSRMPVATTIENTQAGTLSESLYRLDGNTLWVFTPNQATGKTEISSFEYDSKNQ